MKSNTVVRSVRISGDLITRLDARALRAGRTRNAEFIVLLEQAIIALKSARGYGVPGSDKVHSVKSIGGEPYQIRVPEYLDRAIVNDVEVKFFLEGTYSDKVRHLLNLGLLSRGEVILVELDSLGGCVYQDGHIDGMFIGLKSGINHKLDKAFRLGRNFEELMVNTQGHVLVHGRAGTGKSFSTGYYKAANHGACHYLDLNAEQYSEMKSRPIILLWSDTKPYVEKKTLVLDDAHHLDSEYLNIFLAKARKKNVRVVLTCQSEKDLEEDVFQHISHCLDFNCGVNGEPLWYGQVNS